MILFNHWCTSYDSQYLKRTSWALRAVLSGLPKINIAILTLKPFWHNWHSCCSIDLSLVLSNGRWEARWHLTVQQAVIIMPNQILSQHQLKYQTCVNDRLTSHQTELNVIIWSVFVRSFFSNGLYVIALSAQDIVLYLTTDHDRYNMMCL